MSGWRSIKEELEANIFENETAKKRNLGHSYAINYSLTKDFRKGAGLHKYLTQPTKYNKT
jgi:hypothetical protein